MMTVTASPAPRRLGWRVRLALTAALFALYPLVLAGTAAADDLGAAVADAIGQTASTGQEAVGNGVATQTEPTNMVISIRINSPGNNGPISQSNVTVVGVGANNGSDTSQGAAMADPGANQQASTGQEAAATGDGTQSQPKNVVISVRINSPGNDGPISQSNLVGVGVGATNAASTSQADGIAAESAPRTAIPVKHPLRRGAAPAEAAHGKTVAGASSHRPGPRHGAPAPKPAETSAGKSLGRPDSGAAAAQTAGLPAAVARAPQHSKVVPLRPAAQASTHSAAAGLAPAGILRHVQHVLPAISAPAGQRAERAGLLTLTVIALLGALLVGLTSVSSGPIRAAQGRRA
jgi:hypothetical protein